MRFKAAVVGTMLAVAMTAAPAAAEEQGGPNGRAYGHHCQGQSKRHVPGMRGTPFSACVRAMAKLDHGTETSPRAACKDMSRRHVARQRGTPFSRCVSAGERLLEDKADDAGDTTGEGRGRGHGRPAA